MATKSNLLTIDNSGNMDTYTYLSYSKTYSPAGVQPSLQGIDKEYRLIS